MNRLCIYAIYDSENIIDNYISNILEEMKNLCEKIVVILNAEDTEKEYFGDLSSADKIIIRQNRGYDAGVYKECLCNYMTKQELQGFDEIVLMNDTFYGPIYPIEDSFRVMKNEKVDFWGMTKHLALIENGEEIFPEHIQSYFLVLRGKIIKDERFYKFWHNLQYPNSVKMAIQDFEIGFNVFLKENGFQGKAMTDLFDVSCLENNDKNPYLFHALELIRDSKIPFLKRKSLDIGNEGYPNALEAYKYLEDNNLYDVNIIKKHLTRKCNEDKYMGLFNLKKLDEFCYKYKKIYIYGAGIMGRNLGTYLEFKKIPLSGYLVTKIDGGAENNVHLFDELVYDFNTGIIIAIARKNIALEILATVKGKYDDEQIFLPSCIC